MEDQSIPEVFHGNKKKSLNHGDKEIITFHSILISIKLDDNNYITWKHQILKIMRSLKLDSFVLNDSPIKQEYGKATQSSKHGRSKTKCWLLGYVLHK